VTNGTAATLNEAKAKLRAAGRVLRTRDSRRGATRGAFYALATIDRRAFVAYVLRD
jgi:hypothetical protein